MPAEMEDGERKPDGAHEVEASDCTPSFQTQINRQSGVFSRAESNLLRRVLSTIGSPPVSIVLWDGTEIGCPRGTEVARIKIQDRPTLWKVLFDPMFQFGEAYAKGRLEVEGDLTKFLELVFAKQALKKGIVRSSEHWLHPPGSNSLNGSRANIHHHYDIGNAFYERWLDDQLVYTCGYFEKPSYTLEEAQLAKMEHVCRKLQLRPGDSVLEAGCGWGALARHMARYHQVKVKAFNISKDQIEYARRRADSEGLSNLVEFIEDDWRNMDDKCDAFVSVGMLEHVGLRNYRQLGDVIHRNLDTKTGRGLIHSIGNCKPQRLNPWIEQRIFPGAYPPTLGESMAILEPNGFAVLDVENLRPHYALTLQHWLDRFERTVDWVEEKYDKQFVRMWRLYLCGSIAAFASGSLQLYQILFAREANDNMPWTRFDLYNQSALENLTNPDCGIESVKPCNPNATHVTSGSGNGKV